MSSHLVLNLLKLYFGLSISLLLVKPHAEASVGILEPEQDTANLIGQFEPADTEPLAADARSQRPHYHDRHAQRQLLR